MNLPKKIDPPVLIILGLIIIIVISLVVKKVDENKLEKKQQIPESNTVERPFVESPLFASGDITCKYPQIMYGNFNENKILYQISPEEQNPIIFTFSNLDEKISKLKYIDTTQTISEVPVGKISEDTDRIVFMEIGQSYTALHTIFKQSGISMYSKQISIFGIPSTTTAIGTCIDS